MKALDAFIDCGLDIKTGVSSSVIRVESVEHMLNKRLVGNGSTIRRDNKPWKLFRFKVEKVGNKVVGWSFDGYKTFRDKIQELEDQIASSKNRIVKEEAQVTNRLVQIKSIVDNNADLKKPMFNQSNTLIYRS